MSLILSFLSFFSSHRRLFALFICFLGLGVRHKCSISKVAMDADSSSIVSESEKRLLRGHPSSEGSCSFYNENLPVSKSRRDFRDSLASTGQPSVEISCPEPDPRPVFLQYLIAGLRYKHGELAQITTSSKETISICTTPGGQRDVKDVINIVNLAFGSNRIRAIEVDLSLSGESALRSAKPWPSALFGQTISTLLPCTYHLSTKTNSQKPITELPLQSWYDKVFSDKPRPPAQR